MTDKELIEELRRAASIWFKNSDLLLLEEMIRRYQRRRASEPQHN
jgi:hypothetical protein